jgi:hypothetical protein
VIGRPFTSKINEGRINLVEERPGMPLRPDLRLVHPVFEAINEAIAPPVDKILRLKSRDQCVVVGEK